MPAQRHPHRANLNGAPRKGMGIVAGRVITHLRTQKDTRRVQIPTADGAANFPRDIEAAPLGQHGAGQKYFQHPSPSRLRRQPLKRGPDAGRKSNHEYHRYRAPELSIGFRSLGSV